MPLREMKWRESRGVLNFGAQGSKAASGLNPGTRLAASPRDRELRLGWENGSWSGRRMGVWGLGSLLITTVLKCLQAVAGLALSG